MTDNSVWKNTIFRNIVFSLTIHFKQSAKRKISPQGQQELSTESVYLTQPPRAILGMVGDGAMTLSTVYNFCFETNNYYQDKKIIYIVPRAWATLSCSSTGLLGALPLKWLMVRFKIFDNTMWLHPKFGIPHLMKNSTNTAAYIFPPTRSSWPV